MPKIIPHLWFDKEAEEAAEFYISVFSNNPGKSGVSKLGSISHYPDAGQEITGQKAGALMTVTFTLDGQEFMALNAGPVFKFNEAISFIVDCKDQAEVDYFWEKLSDEGDENAKQCGWIKDKYGLSWQIVPQGMEDLLGGDPEGAKRAMNAMLKMKKLDIQVLKDARDGK